MWNEKFEDYTINQEHIFSEDEDIDLKIDKMDKEINELKIHKTESFEVDEEKDEKIENQINVKMVNVSPLQEK